MKIIIALFLSCMIFLQSNGQRFDWANSGGYTGIANSFYGAIDIATDQQGNVYTMDVAFGKQSCQGDTLSPFSGYTTFIYKFDSLGSLEFINRVGATDGGTFQAFNIETDPEGNLYLLGQPNGVNKVIVNNDTVPAVPHTSLLIKIDPAGNYVWSVNTGFASNGEGCMLQYHNGHVYYQSGRLSVSKTDISGNTSNQMLTASYYNSPTASQELLYKGSAIFQNGDLLFAAYSRGTVAFGTDTLYHTGNPFLTAPVLLVRSDENLNLIWANYLSNGRDPDKNFIPVATDVNDNIYTAVQVNYEMIVGTDTILNPENIFIGVGAIAKTNANGLGVWAKRIDNNGRALPWSMLRSFNGTSVIIGGGFTGNAQIGPFTLNNGTNSLPYIATLNSEGIFTNAFSILQEPSGTDVNCLSDAGNGNYLAGGKMQAFGSPELGCIPFEALPGFYLGRFSENPANVPVPQVTATDMLLTADPPFIGEKQWFLNNEAIQGANEQTFTATQPGNYHVVYSYSTGCTGSETSNTINLNPNALSELPGNKFSYYPNPVIDNLFLKGTANPTSLVEIMSASGKLIRTIPEIKEEMFIDFTHFSPGIYFIRISQQNEVQTLKVVKL